MLEEFRAQPEVQTPQEHPPQPGDSIKLPHEMKATNFGWSSILVSEARAHLQRVYLALVGTTLASALGALFFMAVYPLHPLLCFVCSIAIIFYLQFHSKSRTTAFPGEDESVNGGSSATPTGSSQRLLLLFLFGFFQGATAGGILALALEMDNGGALVTTAFVASASIFACFSGAALTARRRSYLYLGGMLSSALTVLFWLALANLFFGLESLFLLNLYGGLLLFCGYVVYDTQRILELMHSGDKDYVSHALTLFIDFYGIFIRILIILMRNQRRKN